MRPSVPLETTLRTLMAMMESWVLPASLCRSLLLAARRLQLPPAAAAARSPPALPWRSQVVLPYGGQQNEVHSLTRHKEANAVLHCLTSERAGALHVPAMPPAACC